MFCIIIKFKTHSITSVKKCDNQMGFFKEKIKSRLNLKEACPHFLDYVCLFVFLALQPIVVVFS
jgi:hypothetical protein